MTGRKEVDVAPLRAAFQRSDLTLVDVAVRLDWYRAGQPDGTRVARVLGLRPSYSHGKRYWQLTTSYETGVAMCRAFEAWPVDVGV